MNKFDLISIGDNATDAFIRLSEAELNCQIDKPECKICMKFASKIPYDSVTEIPAGGNSSNVAMGTTKLDLKVALVSNIGADEYGAKTLRKLSEAGIDTTWVKKNTDIPTNYNYVLWYADDRTILVKHEDYPDYWPRDLPEANWLYLSSVSDDDFSLHQQITDWLTTHPETKLTFSPGTWQIKAGVEKLKAIYARTEILFCNKQEAIKISEANLRNATSSEPEVVFRKLAESIKTLGPKTIVITDGENGANVLDNQNNFYRAPTFTDFGPALERTGAGDAFASAFLVAITNNLPADQALAWGTINSASVVTQIGPHAGLLTRTQIEKKIK